MAEKEDPTRGGKVPNKEGPKAGDIVELVPSKIEAALSPETSAASAVSSPSASATETSASAAPTQPPGKEKPAPADYESTRKGLDRLLQDLEEEEKHDEWFVNLTSPARIARLEELNLKAQRLLSLVEAAYQHATLNNDWCDVDQHIVLGSLRRVILQKVEWVERTLTEAKALRQQEEMAKNPPEPPESPLFPQERLRRIGELRNWVDQQLLLLKGIPFAITPESDDVETKYEDIGRRIKSERSSLAGPELTEIEKKFLKEKFIAYRTTILYMIDKAADVPAGSADLKSDRKSVYDARIYQAMNQIAREIEISLSDPALATRMSSEIEKIRTRVNAYSYLIYSTNATWPAIIGDGKVRMPPGNLVTGTGENANFPFDAKGVLNHLIGETVSSSEFGEGYNPSFGSRTIPVENYFGTEGTIDFGFNQTAMSWCMNYVRQIMARAVPHAINDRGEMILSSNLHVSENALINHVYQELLNYMRTHNLSQEIPRVSKTMIKRAFQAVILLTGDHCALAKGSVAGLSDKIYYLLHLLEYQAKYASQGKTDANLLPIMMLSTFKDEETGEYYNPVRGLLREQKRLLTVENKITWIGGKKPKKVIQKELFKAFGWTTTMFLLEPLLTISDAARGYEPAVKFDESTGRGDYDIDPATGQPKMVDRKETLYMASPLASLPLKANQRHWRRGKISLSGAAQDMGPVRYAPSGPGDQSNPTVTVNDFQSTNDGEIPFSAIDWDLYTEAIAAYWNNLENNGMWLLDILMSSEEEFIKRIGDLSKLGTTDNKVGYAVPLIAKAAPEVASGRSREHPTEGWKCPWRNYMMYGITVRLILARCMLMVQITGKEAINVKDQIDEFLNAVSKERVFPLSEEATKILIGSIRAIALEGQGLRMATLRFGLKFQENLRQVTKVT